MPRPPRKAIGEHAGGERVGFGGVVGIDGVEIARHQKGRPVASGRQKQPGVAAPERAPVDAGHATRRPERHGLLRLAPRRARIALGQLDLEAPRQGRGRQPDLRR